MPKIDGPSKKKKTIRLTEQEMRKLKAEAEREMISVSSLVRRKLFMPQETKRGHESA